MYGKDFTYPTSQELDYYASKGFSVVQLPYCWQRLQRVLFGKLDDAGGRPWVGKLPSLGGTEEGPMPPLWLS